MCVRVMLVQVEVYTHKDEQIDRHQCDTGFARPTTTITIRNRMSDSSTHRQDGVDPVGG